MKREYTSWASSNLGRTMEFLWFGDRGYPVLFFPTSMGRFYQNEDFGLTGALADKVDAGLLQLVCVDSVDEESWYNKSAPPAYRVRRHDDYDRYIRWEMIPYIQERARRWDLGTCGASFGAYHAANIAGRYPGIVSKAVLFSGLYHIGRYLDGYWDETAYYHSPASYIPNMDEEWTGRLRKVDWIVATGEHDSLIAENRELADILWRKGVPATAEFWPGVFGHDWPFWNEAVRRFL
jgi:esterase/lipase superfamily enzyme